MDITGTLYKKLETQTLRNDFQKRSFIVKYEENPMYPQLLEFELIQDKTNLIDPFNEGDQIKVEFNLRGREWQAPDGNLKYFNTLQAWRLSPAQPAGGQVPPQAATSQNPPPKPPEGPIDVTQLEDDDLPF